MFVSPSEQRTRQQANRVAAAASALQLSSNTVAEAQALLSRTQAFFAEERLPITPTTLAAVVYAAARSCDVPLSLTAAGGPLQVHGVAVGREFRWAAAHGRDSREAGCMSAAWLALAC